ncbi:ATP-NAD kinase-like domain-containing protein [Sordaria brevicollis]|uniref:ATP-NAD kinase-like domain-containing protein n=1 Tax=Sordaria brevicollis TaxID=83679 RepID=A0AAE0PI46_SORBR|nr:ATP-NAD kinase-like domain-containing protein [Sordaria brevicollis]
MPSWLKNITSLGRRRKGSTTAGKQDLCNKNSQSDTTKSTTSQLKAPVSDKRNSQLKTDSDSRKVGERTEGQSEEQLPRNTKETEQQQQPRDTVNPSISNMTPAATGTTTADKAAPPPPPANQHTHINQRTGDLIQTTTTTANGVGDIENAGSAINHNQIVFILRGSESSGGGDGYRIYSLVEEEPGKPAAADDKDGEKVKKAKAINGKDSGVEEKASPFKLSVTHAHDLPDDMKREFLVEKAPGHLANVDELHVIVSTRSGLGLAAGFYESVLKTLLEEGFGFEGVGDVVPGHENDHVHDAPKGQGKRIYHITVTKSADTVKDFARSLVSSSATGTKQPSRTIILLSGDGGIIDLLNGLDHPSSLPETTTPTLAILPLGTGNALFHSLHKPLYSASSPSPLILGLRTLFKRGVSAPLPTFRAEFSPGAKLISGQPEVLPTDDDEPKDNLLFDVTGGDENEKKVPKPRPTITHLLAAIVFSYGFHAQLVYESDTPSYRKHGDKRFGMAAGELLKISHQYNASLSIRSRSSSSATASTGDNWQELSRDTHSTYILTTLVSNLEKTFCISPDSKPLDGQLRLVHFGFGEDVEGEERGKRTMDVMMAAYRDGEHVQDSEGKFKGVVGYEEVEEIKVVINEEDERWRKVCVDGTIVEVEKGGWVSVRRDGTEGGEGVRERLRVLVDEGVVVGRG